MEIMFQNAGFEEIFNLKILREEV